MFLFDEVTAESASSLTIAIFNNTAESTLTFEQKEV